MSVSSSSTTLSSLVIEPASVNGGAPPQPLGTITLAGPAPEGGVELALASNRPDIAQVPPSIMVPAGTEATFFHVTVRPTPERVQVVITASLDGDARASTLQVSPMSSLAVVASPTTNGTTPDAPRPDSATAQPGASAESPDTSPASTNPARLTPLLPCRDSFRGALVLVIPAAPVMAIIATVGIYLLPQGDVVLPILRWAKPNSVLVGIGAAILVALVLAALFCWAAGTTSADHANSSAFGQLVARLRELEARVRVATGLEDLSPGERIARAQAVSFCELIRTELGTPGARWVLGTGYILVWNLVHRAEQAMLLVEPVEDVLRLAIFDDMRLQGSNIDNSADLLVKLRLAITRLQPEAAGYFAQQAGTQTHAQDTPTTESPGTITAARAALAQVHSSIDGFRDTNWDALVRTRNHLLGTITATGIGTYLLLAVALGVSGPAAVNPFSDPIVGASTFFLIGAMVGLFNRLYKESSSDNSIEDYGLTTARLGLTPILSGLAALGGVLAVAMLPAVMSSGIFLVSSAGAAPASGVEAAIPALAKVYSLQDNAFGVVFAGIFGLAPGLLLNSLQAASDKYRASIQSTATATSSTS